MSITRYELEVELRAQSPIHSGGTEERVDRGAQRRYGDEARQCEPRLFARDATGTPVLPGRSVKGSLRAACEEAFGATTAHLWGGQDRASAMTVHAIALDRVEAGTELAERTGIAVDRYWGMAGDGALFVHEILPPGARLSLRLSGRVGSLDDDGDTDGFEELLGQILGVLKAGRVSFGGRQNAGWGRVGLASGKRAWRVEKTTLDSKEALRGFLDDTPPGIDIEAAPVPVANQVRIDIAWNSPTGILVAEPRPPERDPDGQETDPALPLRARPARPEEPAPPLVLPGSSVRGALRSRATRIARTILLADDGAAAPADWSSTEVHAQLAQDPQLVRDLFGSTQRRGALMVLDTLAQGKEPKAVKRTHNAGDRWTGGVANGLLFSEEVPLVKWNRIRLALDLNRIQGGDDQRRAAMCLLGLTLAELAAGTLPLGSRGTRGLGQVRVTGITVTGAENLLGDGWSLKADGDDATGLARALLDRLRAVNDLIGASEAGGSSWADYLNGPPKTNAAEAAQDVEGA